MRNRSISKLFSIFILLMFFIAGIYQSFDAADSFFVCINENIASLYEPSVIDHTQEAILENASPLTQLIWHRKEQEIHSYLLCSVSTFVELYSNLFTGYIHASFTEIIEENCINHFSSSIITDYIHLKDGQKIA